jgi:hypothetical protein
MAQKHLSELLLAAPEIQPRVPRRTLSPYTAQAFPTPLLGRGFATVLRHLHDTHPEPTNIAVNLPSLDGRPIHFRVGGCTNGDFRYHLLFLLSRFAKFSREERPEGSLRAFAWSDVAEGSTPIRSINVSSM